MKATRNRNKRHWFNDGQSATLAKHHDGRPVAVRIVGLSGDSDDGHALYVVEEVQTRERYTASDKDLTVPARRIE